MCIIIFYTDADKMIEKITTLDPPNTWYISIYNLILYFYIFKYNFWCFFRWIMVISKCISLDYEIKESKLMELLMESVT